VSNIPGQMWQITHKCHKREFLLRLQIDRKKWIHWLYEVKKQYGLITLNYAVTSNHYHLLVDACRQAWWSESIAVGSEFFVENIKSDYLSPHLI
jgi:REP element-mobilizing transposase RayT